ncbi:hypothetical protein ACH34S_32680 [Actinomadura sp. 3N508]
MERIQIRVAADDEGGELAALLSWLRADRTLRGRVRPGKRPPLPGELGGVLETVDAVIETAAASMALAQALSAWLQARRRPAVRLSITTRDGRTLELETDDSAEACRLVAELLGHTGDGDG